MNELLLLVYIYMDLKVKGENLSSHDYCRNCTNILRIG